MLPARSARPRAGVGLAAATAGTLVAQTFQSAGCEDFPVPTLGSRNWKVPRTRRLESLRYGVSGKYSFDLKSQERRRPLPGKIIVGQKENESVKHVMLKFLAYVLFYRERIQIEPRLPDETIPFEPDVIQLDYSLRPSLWVECGECGVGKLHKLAVKVPEAEIWILKPSL